MKAGCREQQRNRSIFESPGTAGTLVSASEAEKLGTYYTLMSHQYNSNIVDTKCVQQSCLEHHADFVEKNVQEKSATALDPNMNKQMEGAPPASRSFTFHHYGISSIRPG